MSPGEGISLSLVSVIQIVQVAGKTRKKKAASNEGGIPEGTCDPSTDLPTEELSDLLEKAPAQRSSFAILQAVQFLEELALFIGEARGNFY